MSNNKGPLERLRPELLESSKVWRGRIFDVVVDRVVLSEGSEPVLREYMKHPGGVGIVALRESGGQPEVLLVSQYRHAVGRTIWEVPAGLRDVDGEPLVETAKRELREEADLEASTWNVLADVLTSPGCSDEELRIFLARDLRATEVKYVRSDEEEAMELRWVPLQDAVSMIFGGQILNPSAVSGIFAAFIYVNDPAFELRDANGASAGKGARS